MSRDVNLYFFCSIMFFVFFVFFLFVLIIPLINLEVVSRTLLLTSAIMELMLPVVSKENTISTFDDVASCKKNIKLKKRNKKKKKR